MSDNGLEDDLFGGSDDGAPPRPPSPVASSSRGSPAPVPTDTESPAKQAADGTGVEEDGDGVDDLFGDDDDAPPSPQPQATGRERADTTPDTVQSSPGRSPNPLEYQEEDVQDAAPQEAVWASIPFPKWDKLKPTDGKVWQLRLPAYVNMDSKPYDPTLYRAGLDTPPEDEDANMKRSRMIQVRNTIRWKWVTGDDGVPKRQSNARLLRWSDGSVSMQLGSDLYDLAPSYGTTLARQSESPPKNPLPTDGPATDTTFLAIASDSAQVMMTETNIAGHLSLVPASSNSKTHIELVKHVGQQHVKHSRMKVLDDIVDPESAMNVQIAKKKAANKRGGGGRGAQRKKRDSSDEDAGDPRYTFDTDMPGSGRPIRGKNEAEYDEDDGFVVADSDDEDAEEEEEGDDDAAYGSSRKSKSKSKKSRKRKGSEEVDEMEEAERRIEALEREKKRAKRDKNRRRHYETDESEVEANDKDAEGEEDMDMEMDSDA